MNSKSRTSTPEAENHSVSDQVRPRRRRAKSQLRLIDTAEVAQVAPQPVSLPMTEPRRSSWKLDPTVVAAGRRGVAEAREVLRAQIARRNADAA